MNILPQMMCDFFFCFGDNGLNPSMRADAVLISQISAQIPGMIER